MMHLIRSLCIASFLAATAVVAGCGSDQNGSDVVDDGKTLSSVEITTGIDTLAKGSMVQFHAMAKYADGSSTDVSESRDTTWNTSDADVATVDSTGNVTAMDVGSVDITATYKGMKAEESFVVTP